MGRLGAHALMIKMRRPITGNRYPSLYSLQHRILIDAKVNSTMEINSGMKLTFPKKPV